MIIRNEGGYFGTLAEEVSVVRNDKVWDLEAAVEALKQEQKKQRAVNDVLYKIGAEISEAMDMDPAWKGQDNYVGGLEIALSIIDKTLSEASE